MSTTQFIVHLINYTLAFGMWLIIGRGVLMVLTANRPNLITKFFAAATDPMYKLVKKVVPFASDFWIPHITFILIILLRLLLLPYVGSKPLILN